MTETRDIRESVREHYAQAAQTASCCSAPLEVTDKFGHSLYDEDTKSLLPEQAIVASLGCGNPTALADLRPGETVLDLGSGGGIDVLLSARRVGPSGRAYGLDMTDEMLALARSNQAEAGLDNVEFLKGHIEDIPLPDNSVDVIISNCVINLSADKQRVFDEALRVLKPGGRLAVSDVVLSGELPAELNAITSLWTGCIAGALTEHACEDGLRRAGFVAVSVEPTRIFGTSDLEELAAAIDPADLPEAVNVAAAVTGLSGVIRSAAIRAIKPGARAVIRVYEPALCCNTGVCGPDVDEALVTFTADLAHLEERGADIARHNLANDPQAFTDDERVRAFLQVAGSQGLPLTTVDGVTVLTGTYPTRDQLLGFAGLPVVSPFTVVEAEGGSCCGSGGCC